MSVTFTPAMCSSWPYSIAVLSPEASQSIHTYPNTSPNISGKQAGTPGQFVPSLCAFAAEFPILRISTFPRIGKTLVISV